jgi:hypothetical protein
MEKMLERTENMTLEELKEAKSAIEKIICARENANRKRLRENIVKALEAYHKEFPLDTFYISISERNDYNDYDIEIDIMEHIQELKEDI